MGKQIYQKEIENLFKKSTVVRFDSIQRIIKSRKNIRQYQKQLIKNLIDKGKIARLSRGYYTVYEDISLAVFCFQPSYLGLQNALSFHNLWEQETVTIIITAKKARNGIREIMGRNVMIRRIDKNTCLGLNITKMEIFTCHIQT